MLGLRTALGHGLDLIYYRLNPSIAYLNISSAHIQSLMNLHGVGWLGPGFCCFVPHTSVSELNERGGSTIDTRTFHPANLEPYQTRQVSSGAGISALLQHQT